MVSSAHIEAFRGTQAPEHLQSLFRVADFRQFIVEKIAGKEKQIGLFLLNLLTKTLKKAFCSGISQMQVGKEHRFATSFPGTVSLQPYGVVLHRNFSCVQDGKGEQKSIQEEHNKKKEGQRKGEGENTGGQQKKSAGRQQEEEIEIQFHENLSVPSAEPPGFAGFEKIGERQKKRRQGEKLQKDIRPDRQGDVQIQAVEKE